MCCPSARYSRWWQVSDNEQRLEAARKLFRVRNQLPTVDQKVDIIFAPLLQSTRKGDSAENHWS